MSQSFNMGNNKTKTKGWKDVLQSLFLKNMEEEKYETKKL